MIAIMIMVVLVIYLSFVFTVSKWVYKKPEKVSSKWLASIGTAVFLLVVPMADNIVGEVYLRYLCATQGGIHVYQTVELGPEYFGEDGVPLFYDKKKLIEEMSLNGRYAGRIKGSNSSRFLNIEKRSRELFDEETGQVLGTIVHFIHFGGKLVNSTGLHVSGTSCPSDELVSNYIITLSKKIFIQKKINKERVSWLEILKVYQKMHKCLKRHMRTFIMG